MPAGRRQPTKQPSAWWVTEVTDTCAACSHGFAHRTEFYCVDCDHPICPVCIEQTITLELICPGCAATRAEELGV